MINLSEQSSQRNSNSDRRGNLASRKWVVYHYTLPIRVRFRQKSKSDIIDKWFIEEETKIKEKRGQVCLFLLRKIQRWVNNNLISGKRNNVKIEKLNASLLGR